VADAGNVVESGDDPMTDAVKEQLSACLDSELPEAQLDLLLKRVHRDADLRDSLGRYALIGEALKTDRPVIASKAFAANVMAAIEAGPIAASPSARISPALLRLVRPVAGMAIAAGVAAVAVFAVQRADVLPLQVAEQTPMNTPITLAAEDSSSYVVPSATTSDSSFVPATRLTNFVVAHSDYSSPLARRSVLTSVLAEDDVDLNPAAAGDAAATDTQPQER
jgi:sigma-E factor negative regulatory protein RseA